MPKTITITLPDNKWGRYVNGTHGDDGTELTLSVLIDAWVSDNTLRNGSINPADWTVPPRTDAPSELILRRAWRRKRDRRALNAIEDFMDDIEAKNRTRIALIEATNSISAAISADKTTDRDAVTFVVSD